MKVPVVPLIAALVLGGGATIHGQETAVPGREAPASETSPPGRAVSDSTNAPLVSVFSSETLRSLGIAPNARVVSVMTNRLDLMEGRRARVEGGLVPLVRRPSLVTFLQLFNPFAPAEYGGMSPGTTDQGFSRAFADPIKTQPTSPLLSIGDRPERSVAKPEAGQAQ